MWEILGYAIIALGSVLSTYLTNKQNKEESATQREWEEEQVDKQNDYNTPLNQVKRSQEAGLNPIAMSMNGGSLFSSVSASPNSYQLPQLYDPMSMLGQSGEKIASAFSSLQSGLSDKTFRTARLQQINEQNEQIKAYVKQLNASTDAQLIANKYADQRELWALSGHKANFDLSYSEIARNNATVKQLNESIKNLIAERSKTQSEIDLNYLRLDEVLAHIANLESETLVNESRVDNIDADTSLKGVQSSNIQAGTDLINAQTAGKKLENSKYVELTDQVIAQYSETIKKIQADTDLTEQQAYWYVFDKADEYSPKFMGVTIDWPRAGKRVKHASRVAELKTGGYSLYK